MTNSENGQTEDRPGMAAGIMLAAVALLGLQDSLVKLASDSVSLWQFQFIRACMNLGYIYLLYRLFWRDVSIRPKRLLPVVVRSMFLVTTMAFFFAGAPVLSTSEMAAGLYVFPIFVTILSALFFGEKVGPRRSLAVFCGFIGALLILKPGTDAFKWVALVPVCAGLCYAGVVLTTRNFCRNEELLTLLLAVNLGYLTLTSLALIGIETFGPLPGANDYPYVFTGWSSISLWTLMIAFACATLNLFANMGLTKAYQSAESSWLAPFDYTYLVFATFWGFILFNQFPDSLSLLGMGMIAGSGTYVAWRERRIHKNLNKPQLNRAMR